MIVRHCSPSSVMIGVVLTNFGGIGIGVEEHATAVRHATSAT